MFKKLLSIGVGLCIGVSAFATGSVGVNPPQNGTLNFTNGIPGITNSFAYPYTVAPVVTLYAISGTNATPLTNNFVTTTNFAVTLPANASTNGVVYWTAAVGATRLQAGSIAFNSGTVTTNVTFPYAYAVTPSVVQLQGSVLGSATNSSPVVTAITTTNFTISAGLTQTVYWEAIGTVANPQSPYQGQYPQNNTIVY